MPNVLPRLIRIQFLHTTEVAPARIRVDDGQNKMTEAYGYTNMEGQSQELMRRFCNRFYPSYRPGTLHFYKNQRYYTLVEK